jgi:hypothetical protein
MQNKRTMIVMSILVLVVGAAAFMGGRMLNNQVNPLGLFGLGGKGGMVSIRINVTPAPELPTTMPAATGQFVERKDNTLVIQSISLKAGGKGVAVAGGSGQIVNGASPDESGPKIEVVITNETKIYRDTTQPKGPPSSNEAQTLQQTVEESNLDKLNSQSMVTVWGRKSGDRIIAEVLLYSNPIMFKRQGP